MSDYAGAIGFALTYRQPFPARFLLLPTVEYERLSFDRFAEVTAHVYTARLGLGYSVALTRSLKVVPEVGAGYTRIDFQADGSAEPERSGPSTWMALNPTYSVADAVGVGVSLGYKAVFLKKPEGLGDSGYNHQLHALMFGATLTYEF